MKLITGKFQLPRLGSDICMKMPFGTRIQHIGIQGGLVTLWGVMDSNETREARRNYWVFGTGEPLPDDLFKRFSYVGSVQDWNYGTWMFGKRDQSLVWHVYELICRHEWNGPDGYPKVCNLCGIYNVPMWNV